ncbi:hypothetical protein [Actinacidiphila sp. bgisy160]|uniref:hypothetical protein n=1 Tax=Actinacidiphila sp. bgisy160 TaxID=3413796 RepID=UPI003D7384B5
MATAGPAEPMASQPRIPVVGGGHGGLHVAPRPRRLLRHRQATVTVVDADFCVTYQPLPAEVAAGSVGPRHVVVPLLQVLPWAPPAVNRHPRVVADWTPALMFPRGIVSLKAVEHSRREFTLTASAATKHAPHA